MAVKREKFTPGWLDTLDRRLRLRDPLYRDRQTYFYDERKEAAHLRIRVMPTCKAHYYIQYRPPISEHERELIKAGEAKRPGPTTFKIGDFTKITFEDAVTLAQEAWVNLEQGIDPKTAKRIDAQIEGPTVREAIHAKIKARGRKVEVGEGGLSDSYIDTMLRQIKTLEKHGFADKKLKQIQPEDAKRLMEEIPKRIEIEGAKRGPGLETSKKILQLLSSIFVFAMDYYWTDEKPSKPVITNNPCAPLVAAKKIKQRGSGRRTRRRAVKQKDLKKVWHAMVELKDYVPDRHNKDVVNNVVASFYFRFQLLTGMRGGTLSKLTFDQYDWDRRTFYFYESHAHKNKSGSDKFYMPLSVEAAQIIDEMHKRHGRVSEYVFPSSTYKTGIDVGCKEQIKIVREKSGVYFKSHDLRGTFLTIGASDSLRIPWETIKQLADHTSKTSDVTAGYLDNEVDSLRAYTQDINDMILEIVGEKKRKQKPDMFELDSNPFNIKESLHNYMQKLSEKKGVTLREVYERCLKIGVMAYRNPDDLASELIDDVEML